MPLTAQIEEALPWLATPGPETTLSGKPIRRPKGSLADRRSRPCFTERGRA